MFSSASSVSSGQEIGDNAQRNNNTNVVARRSHGLNERNLTSSTRDFAGSRGNNSQGTANAASPMSFVVIDIESIKGKFGWDMSVSGVLPYIIRIVNGEQLRYFAMRHAEQNLLYQYLSFIHHDVISKCTDVHGLHITNSEAKLLTSINNDHSNMGHYVFTAKIDVIVSAEDIFNLHEFLKECYKRLRTPNLNPEQNKFGYLRIKSKLVPYVVKDQSKYVSLFFFKKVYYKPQINEYLKKLAVELENNDLAYLKFCCLAQGEKIEDICPKELCSVIEYNILKRFVDRRTNLKLFSWPITKCKSLKLCNETYKIHQWIKSVEPFLDTIFHSYDNYIIEEEVSDEDSVDSAVEQPTLDTAMTRGNTRVKIILVLPIMLLNKIIEQMNSIVNNDNANASLIATRKRKRSSDSSSSDDDDSLLIADTRPGTSTAVN